MDEIKLCCNSCNGPLTVWIIESTKDSKLRLKLIPCPNCLENAKRLKDFTAPPPPATRWYKPSEKLPPENRCGTYMVMHKGLMRLTQWGTPGVEGWCFQVLCGDDLGRFIRPHEADAWMLIEPPPESLPPVVDAKCCVVCKNVRTHPDEKEWLRCSIRNGASVRTTAYCDRFEKDEGAK